MPEHISEDPIAALYRVRITGEVIAAAGPRAVRRVPIETKDGPNLLEFTRAWRELDELPGQVREDIRLEIEVQTRDGRRWRPLDHSLPSGTEADEAEDRPAAEATTALDGASYSELQQIAKALGLKAQGTKDDLLDATRVVLESEEALPEAAEEALASLRERVDGLLDQ